MEQLGPRWCLRVCLLASIFLVLLTAFQWPLVDILTPFLVPFVLAGAWLGFLGSSAWAISHLVRQRHRGRAAAYPLAVCTATVLLALVDPFTTLWLSANYRWYREDREAIVRQVQSGILRPNVAHNAKLIALGSDAPYVSMGGNQIVVEEHDGLTSAPAIAG